MDGTVPSHAVASGRSDAGVVIVFALVRYRTLRENIALRSITRTSIYSIGLQSRGGNCSHWGLHATYRALVSSDVVNPHDSTPERRDSY